MTRISPNGLPPPPGSSVAAGTDFSRLLRMERGPDTVASAKTDKTVKAKPFYATERSFLLDDFRMLMDGEEGDRFRSLSQSANDTANANGGTALEVVVVECDSVQPPFEHAQVGSLIYLSRDFVEASKRGGEEGRLVNAVKGYLQSYISAA